MVFLHSFLKFTSVFIYFLCFVCMTQFWHDYFCTNSFWNPVTQCPKLKVGLKFWSASRCFPSQLRQHSRGRFHLWFASWNPGQKRIINFKGLDIKAWFFHAWISNVIFKLKCPRSLENYFWWSFSSISYHRLGNSSHGNEDIPRQQEPLSFGPTTTKLGYGLRCFTNTTMTGVNF